MKKILVIISILTISALIFSACSKKANETEKTTNTDTKQSSETTNPPTSKEANEDDTIENSSSKTITYVSENGPIKVPSDPRRIVVLNSFVSGSVMALGSNIVGVDTWSMANPQYKSYIKNAVEVSDENLEQILDLNPDLIIAAPTNKNIDKLKKIAPTVIYTYGKLDYLSQILEVGKLLNKEQKAKDWIDDYKTRVMSVGGEINNKIGKNATVTIMESYDKQLYVYGNNWGRGTEILYQEMKLAMPKAVKKVTSKDGYFAISPEVLSDYAGDYIIFSKNSTADYSFQETKTYKNIPAVKNNRVFEYDSAGFYFNDPITLDYQLELFKKSFLNN